MTNGRKKKDVIMQFRFILAHFSFMYYFCVESSTINENPPSNTNGTFIIGTLVPHQMVRNPVIQDDRVEAGTCPSKIYSCRGRCGYPPRFACSCHHTCQIYGNCCEDYAEICDSSSSAAAEVTGNFPTPGDVTLTCMANSLLISSCSKQYYKSLNHKGHEDQQNIVNSTLMAQILKSGFSEMDVLSHCINEDKSNRIVMNSPVTDRQSQLHYKNLFCAACNNALAVEFWEGFIKCKMGFDNTGNDKSNLSVTTSSSRHFTIYDGPHTVMESAESMMILTHDLCSITWLPASGATNRCFKDADLSHDVTVMEEDGLAPMIDHHGEKTHHHVVINATISMDDTMLPSNESELSSFDLNWQNVGTSNDYVNVTEVDKRCQELTSYVEIPRGSGRVYKNKYCYMAHHNYSSQILQFCEPDIKEKDQGESWFILKRQQDLERNATWLDDAAWNLTVGLSKTERGRFVHAEAEEGCDRSTSIVENGKCHRKLFLLRIKIEFTFKYSSLIKGNFNEQVHSYSSLFEEKAYEYRLNQIFCITLYHRRYRSETNTYKYTSETEYVCARENQEEAPNGNSNLANSGSNLEDYKNFVTDVLNSVTSTKSIVKVPVTIKVIPCIFIVVDKVTSLDGLCSEMTSEWRIERNVDAIIGGISLEGIITIICCILSDIGLLVRLALQNVVPFYKSYPGKIQFNLCLSLLLAYTLFLIGGTVDEGTMICKVIAILTHLAFLSALFWMNVTAFEIWRTFRHWRNQVVSRGYVSLILSVFYAVGIPFLYVVTALILENVTPTSELSPAYGEHYCWLNGSMAVAFFFVIPCSFICCMNIVFVGLTLRGLRRQRTSISEFKKSSTKTAVTDTTIVVKIILLVGITWLLGLLAALVDNQALWIIFTIINASLGFMISCVLVINKRVYYAVQNKCLCYTVESTAVVSTQVPRH